MALPASDLFSGSGALSASWTNAINSLTKAAGWAIEGADDVDCLAFWNADSFGVDQSVTVTVGQLGSGTGYIGPAVRCDAASGGNCYNFNTDGSSGSGHSEFAKIINGTYSGLKVVAVTFTVGDTITLEVSGSTLTLKKNGSLVDTVATGGQLTGGSAGMYVFHSAASPSAGIDDWTGDNLAGVGGGPFGPAGRGMLPYVFGSAAVAGSPGSPIGPTYYWRRRKSRAL